jgi:ATP-binding cassette subfamily C (CFTR/MRP) protein 4
VKFRGNFTSLQKFDHLLQYLNVNDSNVSKSVDNKEVVDNSFLSYNVHVNTASNKDKENDSEETEKLIYTEKARDKRKEVNPLKATNRKSINGNSVYWKYFTAGGSCIMPLVTLLAFIIAQFLTSSSDYFIGYWYEIHKLII